MAFKRIIFFALLLFCVMIGVFVVSWWNRSPYQSYVPPTPQPTNFVSQALFNVQIEHKYGCINNRGRVIIQPLFEDIHCSSDQLIPVESNAKWGYVNQNGESVLEPQFSLINHGYSNNFSEGLAVVCQNQKCGYIDSTGNYAIPPRYDYADNFSEGLAVVTLGSYDILGHRIQDPKPVVINKAGEIVFGPSNIVFGNRFSDGLARVFVDHELAFMDMTGKIVFFSGQLDIGDFHEGLAVFGTNAKPLFGYADKHGNIILPQQFKQAGNFSYGLAAVMFDNGKYGYIDRNGKNVVEPIFDYADEFYEGRAVVSIGRLNGYIDPSGKVTIPVQFGSAERFKDGLARVSFDDQNPPYENKKYGYVDKDGNFIWEPSN